MRGTPRRRCRLLRCRPLSTLRCAWAARHAGSRIAAYGRHAVLRPDLHQGLAEEPTQKTRWLLGAGVRPLRRHHFEDFLGFTWKTSLALPQLRAPCSYLLPSGPLMQITTCELAEGAHEGRAGVTTIPVHTCCMCQFSDMDANFNRSAVVCPIGGGGPWVASLRLSGAKTSSHRRILYNQQEMPQQDSQWAHQSLVEVRPTGFLRGILEAAS